MTGTRRQRLEGLYDTAALRTKRVVVVGLGSGGSTVALELAKAGVARLTLIDPIFTIKKQGALRLEPSDPKGYVCY